MASVFITGTLDTNSPTDSYATHDSRLGLGGHREVLSIAERDAIPTPRRRVGMTVYVQQVDTTYQLRGGLLNTNWQTFGQEFTPGGTTAEYLRGDGTAADFAGAVTSVITPLIGVANGLVPLGPNGRISPLYLDPVAIKDTFIVADEAEQLALTAQVGDVAVRTDINTTFILRAEPASTLGNWQQILTPAAVQSVNGQTGVVTLTASDVSALPIPANGYFNESLGNYSFGKANANNNRFVDVTYEASTGRGLVSFSTTDTANGAVNSQTFVMNTSANSSVQFTSQRIVNSVTNGAEFILSAIESGFSSIAFSFTGPGFGSTGYFFSGAGATFPYTLRLGNVSPIPGFTPENGMLRYVSPQLQVYSVNQWRSFLTAPDSIINGQLLRWDSTANNIAGTPELQYQVSGTTTAWSLGGLATLQDAVSGRFFTIGTGHSVGGTGTDSMVIGASNTAVSNNSIVVGASNTAQGSNLAVFGANNTVGQSRNAAFGQSNTVTAGLDSVHIGRSHADTLTTGASLQVGFGHPGNLIGGVITGTFGNGQPAPTGNSYFTGQFSYQRNLAHFVVANGASATARRNAFEVRRTGAVFINTELQEATGTSSTLPALATAAAPAGEFLLQNIQGNLFWDGLRIVRVPSGIINGQTIQWNSTTSQFDAVNFPVANGAIPIPVVAGVPATIVNTSSEFSWTNQSVSGLSTRSRFIQQSTGTVTLDARRETQTGNGLFHTVSLRLRPISNQGILLTHTTDASTVTLRPSGVSSFNFQTNADGVLMYGVYNNERLDFTFDTTGYYIGFQKDTTLSSSYGLKLGLDNGSGSIYNELNIQRNYIQIAGALWISAFGSFPNPFNALPETPQDGTLQYVSSTGRFQGYANNTWRDLAYVPTGLSDGAFLRWDAPNSQITGTTDMRYIVQGNFRVWLIGATVNLLANSNARLFFVIGENNSIGGSGANETGNMVIGDNNTVTGAQTFAQGLNNSATGFRLFVTGNGNIIGGLNNFAFGFANNTISIGNFLIGESNALDGVLNFAQGIGHGDSGGRHTAFFGQYADIGDGGAGVDYSDGRRLLIVGNGMGPGITPGNPVQRSTAFAVQKNGSLFLGRKIQPAASGSPLTLATTPGAAGAFLMENINGVLHWNGVPILTGSRTPGQLQAVFDGGTVLPTAGSEYVLRIPANCQITGWFALANGSATADVELRADSFANWPLTGADVISGPDGIDLTASDRASSSNLSSWTRTNLNAGELVSIRLNSVSGSATRIYIILTVNYV